MGISAINLRKQHPRAYASVIFDIIIRSLKYLNNNGNKYMTLWCMDFFLYIVRLWYVYMGFVSYDLVRGNEKTRFLIFHIIVKL